MRFRFILISISIAITSTVAEAQKAFDPLKTPGQQLLCKSISSPVGDQVPVATSSYEFEEGRELVDDRVIQATFDSAGAPIVLVLYVTELLKSGGSTAHALGFRFMSRDTATGYELLNPEAATGSRHTDPNVPKAMDASYIQPLAQLTVVRARALAEWLWDHRCRH